MTASTDRQPSMVVKTPLTASVRRMLQVVCSADSSHLRELSHGFDGRCVVAAGTSPCAANGNGLIVFSTCLVPGMMVRSVSKN